MCPDCALMYCSKFSSLLVNLLFSSAIFLFFCSVARGLGGGCALACSCATDTSAAACSSLKVRTISNTLGCAFPTIFLSFKCQPSRLLLVRQSPISEMFHAERRRKVARDPHASEVVHKLVYPRQSRNSGLHSRPPQSYIP